MALFDHMFNRKKQDRLEDLLAGLNDMSFSASSETPKDNAPAAPSVPQPELENPPKEESAVPAAQPDTGNQSAEENAEPAGISVSQPAPETAPAEENGPLAAAPEPQSDPENPPAEENAANQPLIAGTLFSDIPNLPNFLLSGDDRIAFLKNALPSLLEQSPEEVGLLVIDMEAAGLVGQNDLPRLLSPVASDESNACDLLWWCIREMRRRFSLFHEAGVTNIASFNEKCNENAASDGNAARQPLPAIVLLIAGLGSWLNAESESVLTEILLHGSFAGFHVVASADASSCESLPASIKTAFTSQDIDPGAC